MPCYALLCPAMPCCLPVVQGQGLGQVLTGPHRSSGRRTASAGPLGPWDSDKRTQADSSSNQAPGCDNHCQRFWCALHFCRNWSIRATCDAEALRPGQHHRTPARWRPASRGGGGLGSAQRLQHRHPAQQAARGAASARVRQDDFPINADRPLQVSRTCSCSKLLPTL